MLIFEVQQWNKTIAFVEAFNKQLAKLLFKLMDA